MMSLGFCRGFLVVVGFNVRWVCCGFLRFFIWVIWLMVVFDFGGGL